MKLVTLATTSPASGQFSREGRMDQLDQGHGRGHLRNDGYFDADGCDIDAFTGLVSQVCDGSSLNFAAGVEHNIPIYDASALLPDLSNITTRRPIMAEWASVLRSASGVLVLKGAYRDVGSIDAASDIYQTIIAEEKKRNGDGADHFAKAGVNDRIWNSLQKLCECDPEVFATYFSNVPVAAVCEAWLGPNYQMTAQVNLVRPGGEAQQAHRDYHLGFQSSEVSASYPTHVHDLSPALTLQGAIAHTDMPVESGPTKLLPFSQLYRAGYAAWRLPDFRTYFEEHYVQLPLEKGDALFFNPALFHGAGSNTSNDIQRMANLLQISSAFGRAMETIDRQAMCVRLFPALAALKAEGNLSVAEIDAAMSSCAEGYSFPTNLDIDPPVGGLAPQTQKQLFAKALEEGWTTAAFEEELKTQENRRRA